MELQTRDMMIEEIKMRSALRDRIIYFSEEIDRDSVMKCRHFFDRIVANDIPEGINPKDAKEIILRIDSYGGDANATMYLCAHIEYLQSLGYTINTEVCGSAYSGGFKLLVVGTNRSA